MNSRDRFCLKARMDLVNALRRGISMEVRSYETDPDGEQKGRVTDPYERLFCAIIVQAVREMFTPSFSRDGDGAVMKHEDAIDFLMSSRLDTYADLIGVNPDYIREAVENAASLIPCFSWLVVVDGGTVRR